jgi:TrmH family RNA methyltransferase
MELAIVLVSPRNPLNIGAAARAMSNFGFFDMRLVNAYDVAYREAKSAVKAGAVLEAATLHRTLGEAVADCTLVVGTASKGHRELKQTLRRLEPAGAAMRRHKGKVGLVFGSEKFGLSNDDLSHCHFMARIPTRDEHESMNLGQAVAVCLYELSRGGPAARETLKPAETASSAELERLTEVWTEVLDASGYLNPRTAASTHLKLRRLMRRLELGGRDAEMLLGMLRQVRWKLKLDSTENAKSSPL